MRSLIDDMHDPVGMVWDALGHSRVRELGDSSGSVSHSQRLLPGDQESTAAADEASVKHECMRAGATSSCTVLSIRPPPGRARGGHPHGSDGLDAVFTALANPHRRRIVDMLALQPASIQQIAGRIGMSLTAINRHIAVLEESGLVQRKKSGRVNFLAVRREAVRQLQDWTQQFAVYWGTDNETLENYVAAIKHADPSADESSTKERKQ